MNTFVGVPQPDSPHKTLLNLVNSVHIGAGASLFISAARTLACAGGFLLGSLGSFPLFGTRNLERFEENFGAPSVRLRRTACGTTAARFYGRKMARHFGTELGTPKPAVFALDAATSVLRSALFDPMMRSSF